MALIAERVTNYGYIIFCIIQGFATVVWEASDRTMMDLLGPLLSVAVLPRNFPEQGRQSSVIAIEDLKMLVQKELNPVVERLSCTACWPNEHRDQLAGRLKYLSPEQFSLHNFTRPRPRPPSLECLASSARDDLLSLKYSTITRSCILSWAARLFLLATNQTRTCFWRPVETGEHISLWYARTPPRGETSWPSKSFRIPHHHRGEHRRGLREVVQLCLLGNETERPTYVLEP
jgi:hypothetical protein